MSLSTDFVIRTGAYDHTGVISESFEENTKKALERYRKARRAAGGDSERLVTGSDDFTMFLWEPEKSTKPVGRLTGNPPSFTTLMSGHQKLINHVSFSPDGRWIASASFDNSVKLWDGRDGK
jgi:ribosome assembly protein 4